MFKKKKKYDKNRYLTVGTLIKTGMYVGAVYYNHPTPSGCERWLLGATTPEFDTERQAGIAINTAYPDVKPIDLDKLSVESADISEVFLKRGSYIQLGYHCQGNKQPESGDTVDPMEFVEVSKPGKQMEIDESISLTRKQLDRLDKSGRVELETVTWTDRNLYYTYRSYRVKRGGEKPKEVQNERR